jgi:uncharacterized protein
MSMWEHGISVYTGLDHSLEANRRYLRLARQYGYTRLFTSLHIPEADEQTVLSDFHHLISDAVSLGYAVTADISPRAFPLLNASLSNLSPLKNLGLSAIRLDFGFSPEQIALISRCSGLEVEINASTITPVILRQIYEAKADFKRMRACHNFYPRPETGLAFALFAERSQMFRDWGIPVFVFIPSSCPRGPIFAGLPTLEKHRAVPAVRAAKELMACHLVDGILFGDPLATEDELSGVASLDPRCIELQVILEPDITSAERAILLSTIHVNRTDASEHVIRSQDSRSICGACIPARAPKPRTPGTVTIDNQNYLRYMGEMQVVLSSLPSDHRVNVAAQVIPEDQSLISYIRPGDTFRLKEVSKK